MRGRPALAWHTQLQTSAAGATRGCRTSTISVALLCPLRRAAAAGLWPHLSKCACRHYAGASSRRSAWACRECGHGTAKWTGRCPACGASGGDVFEEVDDRLRVGGGRRGHGPTAHRSSGGADPVPLSELSLLPAIGDDLPGEKRIRASQTTPALVEFDVVVGGGLMPGSLVLLGGEPGVGKTTLLLQVAAAIARSSAEVDATPRVLYASGEETVSQIVNKAHRLLGSASGSVEAAAGSTHLPRVRTSPVANHSLIQN